MYHRVISVVILNVLLCEQGNLENICNFVDLSVTVHLHGKYFFGCVFIHEEIRFWLSLSVLCPLSGPPYILFLLFFHWMLCAGKQILDTEWRWNRMSSLVLSESTVCVLLWMLIKEWNFHFRFLLSLFVLFLLAVPKKICVHLLLQVGIAHLALRIVVTAGLRFLLGKSH